MTTASKITLARIALVPIFMIMLLCNNAITETAALVIFIIASVTDGVDGYVARRYDQVTTFGKFIDPLADKLLVTSAILIFVERGQMPAWAAMIIISRDFIVSSLRLVAVNEGTVIAAMLSGKIKMIVQVVCICIIMTPIGSAAAFGAFTVSDVSVWVMVAVTAVSGIDYCIKNKDILNVKR